MHSGHKLVFLLAVTLLVTITTTHEQLQIEATSHQIYFTLVVFPFLLIVNVFLVFLTKLTSTMFVSLILKQSFNQYLRLHFKRKSFQF